jgi:hypothetical protein
LKFLFNLFYENLKTVGGEADHFLHTVSEAERKEIIKTERFAVWISAIIGAVMVLLYAIPVNYVPLFEYSISLKLPETTSNIEIQIIALLYGFLLVILEVMLLTLLDIYNTHKIAAAVGFINNDNKNDREIKEYIINFGSQKSIKEIHELGLNPFWGINKIYYIILNTFYKLKATFSNYLIRIFVSKLAGRYATRMVLDLAGIPVFAFWNAWSTKKIIKEARIHLIGLAYINILTAEIKNFRKLNEKEKVLVYDLLQFIVVSKRDYHLNHYKLSEQIIHIFEISIEKTHKISDSFFNEYKLADEKLKKIITKILILGFLLDGNISNRELNRLSELRKKELVTIENDEIKNYLRQFNYGEGFSLNL